MRRPSVSLINSQQIIRTTASTSYADLFRSVPGVNVTQTSARDINITSRGASVDALDLAAGARRRPQHLPRLLRVHRVGLPAGEPGRDQADRGHPRPGLGHLGRQRAQRRRERHHQDAARDPGQRTSRSGFGGFDRETRRTRSRAPARSSTCRDRTRRRSTSAGRTRCRPASTRRTRSPRPTGTIPNGTGTPYPDFTNTGTTQPKFDVRVDRDFEDGKKLVFQGGVAGTDGILHSGIGPFDIDRGTVLSYGKVNFSKGALKANFFTNILDGSATNLLAYGPTASCSGSTSRARPSTSRSATSRRSARTTC